MCLVKQGYKTVVGHATAPPPALVQEPERACNPSASCSEWSHGWGQSIFRRCACPVGTSRLGSLRCTSQGQKHNISLRHCVPMLFRPMAMASEVASLAPPPRLGAGLYSRRLRLCEASACLTWARQASSSYCLGPFFLPLSSSRASPPVDRRRLPLRMQAASPLGA